MLAVAIGALMDWRAVKLGLDLDGNYAMVAMWGGAMLAPIALLLVTLCVCLAGRARSSVASGCLILGLLAAAVFVLSSPYYIQAIATPSRGNDAYEPSPLVVTLGDPAGNPIAMGAITVLATLILSLLALRTLPEGTATPAELRGLRGVPARLRTLRRGVVLNPVRLAFGPIFQRDVRITGRHRSTYVYRALYPALLLGITAVAYVGMSRSFMYGMAQGQGGRVAELQSL